MARYFVKGVLKPGKKAEFAAHLKEGTLAAGTPVHDSLVEGLRRGRATMDDAYFTVDADAEGLRVAREQLAEYFRLERVVPEGDVPEHVRDGLASYDPLPQWAGVD